MKVYLLNAPFLLNYGRAARWQDTGRAGTLYYPVWLAYAAGVLERLHSVRLVDAPAWGWDGERTLSDIRGWAPDMVILDTSFPSLESDVQLAARIKAEFPGVKTVLVGPPMSQVAEKVLQNPGIDIVARLEYDLTLEELAQALEQGKAMASVAGISYRENGEIIHNPDRPFTTAEDLEQMPFVSGVYKKHLNIRHYFLGQSLYPEVQILTGRGCPHRCGFCAWPQTLMGHRYRVRSIASVLEEMEWIEDSLPGVKDVFFEDDTFTIDKRRVAEFCRGYRQRGLRVAWSCNARVDLNAATMAEMARSGCRLLVAGYESGDDEILHRIHKGTTTLQASGFAADARRAGLLVHGDFIIGLPLETRQSIEKTKAFIREVRPDILQVSVATPFPGTEFYRWAQENGYIADEEHYLDLRGHQKPVLSYPRLSAGDIAKSVDDILRRYYLSPAYLPLAARQVFRRNGTAEAVRLGRSALAFLRYARRQA